MKRKGTKAARKIPNDFEFIRMEFLAEVKTVSDYDIPPELIINFDQTNVNIVPVGDYRIETSPDNWSRRQATGESLLIYLLLKQQ